MIREIKKGITIHRHITEIKKEYDEASILLESTKTPISTNLSILKDIYALIDECDIATLVAIYIFSPCAFFGEPISINDYLTRAMGLDDVDATFNEAYAKMLLDDVFQRRVEVAYKTIIEIIV